MTAGVGGRGEGGGGREGSFIDSFIQVGFLVKGIMIHRAIRGFICKRIRRFVNRSNIRVVFGVYTHDPAHKMGDFKLIDHLVQRIIVHIVKMSIQCKQIRRLLSSNIRVIYLKKKEEKNHARLIYR